MRDPKTRRSKGTTGGTSILFSTAGVIIIGGLALVTLSRAFLAAKLENDVKRELQSGPPKHMLNDWSSSSSSLLLDQGGQAIDPLADSLEKQENNENGDKQGEDVNIDLIGTSHTEKFLDTMHSQDGGRKYIQRLLGGSISNGNELTTNDDNEFNLDDDRAYSLWATNIDKMKLLWAQNYALEDSPNIEPNPKPNTESNSQTISSIKVQESNKNSNVIGGSGGGGLVSSVLGEASGTAGSWKEEALTVALAPQKEDKQQQSPAVSHQSNDNHQAQSNHQGGGGSGSDASIKVSNAGGNGVGVKWSDDAEELERLRFGPGSQKKENKLAFGKPEVDKKVAQLATDAENVAVMLGVTPQVRDAGIARINNYFSEELPKHHLDHDLEAILNDAGGVKLSSHAQGWFVESNITNKGVMAKRAEKGRNVVFIKVAKAGGTTLQELLQRYSIEKHLIVASPEHVKKETSFHRGKANILSRHCTLPNFLELKFISRPYFFVTLLRDPLQLAVSMFYWKHQEKRAAPYKYMRRFRQEEKGYFSDRHRAHIHVFASQDEELRNRLPDYSIYGYMPQYAWFGDTVKNAIKELVMRSFLVGLVHRFDHLIVMLRYKLGVDVRQMIAVSTNHYRHPKPDDWPPLSLTLLNNTGKIQTDWKFMTAAERIYNKQVREFGSSRLKQEVKEYSQMMKNLRKTCDPEGKEFKAAQKFLPRCKPGQGQCVFDADKCVKCMLSKYDSCAAGTAVGFGHCEREVRINLAQGSSK